MSRSTLGRRLRPSFRQPRICTVCKGTGVLAVSVRPRTNRGADDGRLSSPAGRGSGVARKSGASSGQGHRRVKKEFKSEASEYHLPLGLTRSDPAFGHNGRSRTTLRRRTSVPTTPQFRIRGIVVGFVDRAEDEIDGRAAMRAFDDPANANRAVYRCVPKTPDCPE
jgi:hypothetical protein